MSMAGIPTCMSLAHTLLLLLGAAPVLWRHRCLHGIPSPVGHIVQWSVANISLNSSSAACALVP